VVQLIGWLSAARRASLRVIDAKRPNRMPAGAPEVLPPSARDTAGLVPAPTLTPVGEAALAAQNTRQECHRTSHLAGVQSRLGRQFDAKEKGRSGWVLAFLGTDFNSTNGCSPKSHGPARAVHEQPLEAFRSQLISGVPERIMPR
jgi:hypothetical protein